MVSPQHTTPGSHAPIASAGATPANISVLPAPADVPESVVSLLDGSQVTIRAMRPDDAELERDFIHRLSPESRRMRFLGQISAPGEALIARLVQLDYQRDMAFIALAPVNGEERAVGVSRYSVAPDAKSSECAVTVSDAWQGRGLGTVLMRHLIDLARRRGIHAMVSVDAADNWRMQELARDLGFRRRPDPDDATQVIHQLVL